MDERVGASFLSVVHGVELVRVVLCEAQFEDELSSSDEAFVCHSPVCGLVGTINVNASYTFFESLHIWSE